jgi:hypothetical protein
MAMRNVLRYSLAAFGLTTGLFAAVAPTAAGEIDDLKAEVGKLMERIDSLEAKAREGAAAAPAPAVSSGNDKIKLAVSGQVNRAVLVVDDGKDSGFFHVDNDNSSTRIRFVGSGRLNEDISAGTLVEVQFESNSSADIDIDQDGEVSANNFTERHLTLYLDSKRLGRLWLGQGDTASNGTSEVDLSGTTVIAYSGIEDLAGGISFRDSASGAKLVTIGGAYSQFDGFSRRDRVRYDSPTFNGFKASTSFMQGDAWDVAFRYSADYENVGTRVAAAIAYGDGAQRFDLEQINGSFSLLHRSGVNFTFASGTQDLDARTTDDPVFYYGKLGYRFTPFTFGKTALAIDYGINDDLAADGDEFASWGVFAVQNIDRIATELYAGFRSHELDRTGVSVDDISVGVAGARVKF